MLAARAFDPFAPGSAPVLVLLGARIGGLLLVAPVFSGRTVPMSVRTGLLLLLTALLQPVALSHAATGVRVDAVTLLGETLVGFALGLGAALFVGAAEVAGDLMAIQIGVSGAALMDPMSNAPMPSLGQFMQLTVIALMLTADAHLVMLDAVAASTRALPVGGAMDLAGGTGTMLGMGGTMFSLGLRFAAPVIAAVLLANVALAVLSRAAPALNILSLAFPVQIAIGLTALMASLPLVALLVADWHVGYDAMLARIADGFGGGR